MSTVTIPAEILQRIVSLASSFGEPYFSAIVGEGDGTINGVEAGRVVVFDAEMQIVARYPAADLATANRLRDLLNAITSDLAKAVGPST